MDAHATTPESLPAWKDQSQLHKSQTRRTGPPLLTNLGVGKENSCAPSSWYGYRAMNNPRRQATKAFRGGQDNDSVRVPAIEETFTAVDDCSTKRPALPLSETAGPPKRRRGMSDSCGLRGPRNDVQSNIISTRVPEPVIMNDTIVVQTHQPAPSREQRPQRERGVDEEYVYQMVEACRQQSKSTVATRGRRQAQRIMGLLTVAQYANETDALFLTSSEASKLVAPGTFVNSPIVTEGQQALPLQTIEQFLEEYYDDQTRVSIQDPGAREGINQPNVRNVTIKNVKERFAQPTLQPAPWNLLELAAHYDDGLRPSFLNNEDCRLLSKIKFPPNQYLEGKRRVFAPGWKEVEKWALLAQAGALTEPHQDSHGYSTFITINVGQVGFGWLANPTDDERRAWRKDPFGYTGGRWRYVVLKPGQTVYFPAGTVHFVFRLPVAGNSLAFGGHVLRCSNLVHWIKTVLEETWSPNITNEDITESVPAFLSLVEKFVVKAKNNDMAERWGGVAEIDEFLRLYDEHHLELTRVRKKTA